MNKKFKQLVLMNIKSPNFGLMNNVYKKIKEIFPNEDILDKCIDELKVEIYEKLKSISFTNEQAKFKYLAKMFVNKAKPLYNEYEAIQKSVKINTESIDVNVFEMSKKFVQKEDEDSIESFL